MRDDQVVNPRTGRLVSKTSKIGSRLCCGFEKDEKGKMMDVLEKDYTLSELRTMGKIAGVVGFSRMKKSQLCIELNRKLCSH